MSAAREAWSKRDSPPNYLKKIMMIQITDIIIVRKMVLLLNYRARGACIASPDRPPPRMVSAYTYGRVPWGYHHIP